MGRHAAPDGAPVHPLVAEALAQREAAFARSLAEMDETAEGATPGDLGWPGSPSPGDGTSGDGLGWPGSLPDAGLDVAALAAATPRGPSERSSSHRAQTRSRGWRRFFSAA